MPKTVASAGHEPPSDLQALRLAEGEQEMPDESEDESLGGPPVRGEQ